MNELRDLKSVPEEGLELGRYAAVEGTRVVVACGARSDDRQQGAAAGVMLVDELLGHPHLNVYPVRGCFRDAAELRAVAAHYLEMVEEHRVSPMELGTEEILLLRPRC